MFLLNYVSIFLICFIVLIVIIILLKVIKLIGLIVWILWIFILYKLCVVKNRFLFKFVVMIKVLVNVIFFNFCVKILVLGVLILNFLIIIKWFWWINLERMFLIVLWYIFLFIFWLWFCGFVVNVILLEC